MIKFVLFILASLLNSLFNSCSEEYTFCFLSYLLRMILFGFQTRSVQNDASSSDIQFHWALFFNEDFLCSLPSNRNEVHWKCQSVHNHLTRLDFQADFLITFGWISSISFGIDFFATRRARSWFWASFIATRTLETEIAEIFSYVSFFFVFELVSWNNQLYLTNQAVNRLFSLEDFTKMTLGFVSCIGKLITNRSFLRVHEVLLSLETHLLTCKTCVFIPRIKVSIDIFSLVTNSYEQVVS